MQIIPPESRSVSDDSKCAMFFSEQYFTPISNLNKNSKVRGKAWVKIRTGIPVRARVLGIGLRLVPAV